jgi:tRNA A-37 threonylcarbamoyl transferase component Bud32
MNKPPFTLKIKTYSPQGGCEEVLCRDVLRALGRTRTVYDATWGNRRIVLKVFAKLGKAMYHAMREWRGLRQLEARQVDSPKPLFLGRSPRGWIVATAWLDGAVTGTELWRAADTAEEKTRILSMIATELARQHDRGVVQSDVHLGNFMVREEKVFTLDPAMMHFRRGPIGPRQSIAHIAQLLCVLPEGADRAIESVFREYTKARSWTVDPQQVERFLAEHRRKRRKAVEWELRKSLRENRRHQAIRQGRWQGLADRKLSEAVDLNEITAGLDDTMMRGRIFKDGRTSFVSQVTLGGIEVVIKRYNHRGLLHTFRHTLKGSRGRRNWLNANRLSLLEIPTPRPLAYIDEYRGPLLYCSYFIAEFVKGQRLHRILRDSNVPEDRKRRLVDGVVGTLDRMAYHGISHGDLKHTNILCDGDKPVFVDLDGMQVHRIAWLQQCRHRRDLARFLRDVPLR